ncbi:mitochondrial ATPase expression-domain-containing protein [Aspergillus pseudoustus]|uniref:Mitochondrial ATPase expression-domain-containing protein n=1 Tax=Aspergillus pseudoustus TaxID=1810923 RepID=A0ABR4KI90_9EURO
MDVDDWGTARGISPAPNPPAIGSSKFHGKGFRSSAQHAQLKREFYSILSAGQPDQVMEALLSPRYEQVIVQLPQSVFVETLRLLSPSYFIEPYKQFHVLLHPHAAKLKRCTPIRVILDEFSTKLSSIIRIRRLAGCHISLAEYTHLLDCARSLGDGLMAEYIWHAMDKERITPDLRCYNYYMESKIWNGCYNGEEQYRLRVTPYAYRRRRTGQSWGWDNYETAEHSLAKEIRLIFEDMKEAGHEPDEATIINLLVANARVGHVDNMKQLLWDTWNIDVDLVKGGERGPVLALEPSSPLYPTTRLLKAIVHAFSTNSDIPAAISLLDHISSSYGVEVTEQIWLEILTGSDAKEMRHGEVSPAFNIKPAFEMHWYFAKAAWNVCNTQKILVHIDRAYELLEETKRKRQIAREIVESYLPKHKDQRIAPDVLRSRGFAEAIRTYDIARLRYVHQTTIIENIVQLLFRPRHVKKVRASAQLFSRVHAPLYFERWRDYLPARLTYKTPTGIVEIQGDTVYAKHSRLPPHDKVQFRRHLETVPNPVFEKTSDTLDDDFIWATYRDRMSDDELNHPLIKLLLAPQKPAFIFQGGQVLDEEVPYGAEDLDQEGAPETEKLHRGLPVYQEPYSSPEFGRLITNLERDARDIKEIAFEHAFGYFRYPELAMEEW